jgi:RNA polymerase sporulation-specific sigma factor
VAKKNPWKPSQMSIMAILKRKTAAWEKMNPPTLLKVVGGRIANEILMHFRSQKKTAQDVSLSDYIETGADGAPLALMDVVSEDLDLLEQVASRETAAQLRRAVAENLTDQEQQVIRLRYGLDGYPPLRQREVAQKTGISRSYVSRIEKRALEKLKQALEQ